jgi:hypothetical protein
VRLEKAAGSHQRSCSFQWWTTRPLYVTPRHLKRTGLPVAFVHTSTGRSTCRDTHALPSCVGSGIQRRTWAPGEGPTNTEKSGHRYFPAEKLAEQALDDHGDEDALDHDADDRLSGGKPGLQRVEAKLHEEDAPVDGVEANLQGVEDVLDAGDTAS